MERLLGLHIRLYPLCSHIFKHYSALGINVSDVVLCPLDLFVPQNCILESEKWLACSSDKHCGGAIQIGTHEAESELLS